MNGAPKTVEEYLDTIPAEARPALERLREALRAAAPEAAETLSYNMPTLKLRGFLVAYSAHKKHYSLHIGGAVLQAHRDELAGYVTTKGSLHLPYDEPLPAALVDRLVKTRIQDALAEAAGSGRRARAESAAGTRREARTPADAGEPPSDLPAGLAAPARRALAAAGLVRLESLAQVDEDELLRLHGMGPRALEQLRATLQARGLSFAGRKE